MSKTGWRNTPHHMIEVLFGESETASIKAAKSTVDVICLGFLLDIGNIKEPVNPFPHSVTITPPSLAYMLLTPAVSMTKTRL